MILPAFINRTARRIVILPCSSLLPFANTSKRTVCASHRRDLAAQPVSLLAETTECLSEQSIESSTVAHEEGRRSTAKIVGLRRLPSHSQFCPQESCMARSGRAF